MFKRKKDLQEISSRLKNERVTAILGPRQSGKTTIARTFEADAYFDLEDPVDLARLENPRITLGDCSGLIVIDEIQRSPGLFQVIRVLVDSRPDQKYLILGSASRDLIRQGSESLAGRISFFTLLGFRNIDVGKQDVSRLWLRGGYPRAYTAETEEESVRWREDYIQTFLERDIPNLGIKVPAPTLRRFWQMVSHYHGMVLNLSEIGRSFGIADTTVRNYLEILQGTFMLRLLQPWYNNAGKRLVKRPKVYFRDSGIFHTLMTIDSKESLRSHPKCGSSWEGFAMDCVWRSVGKPDEQAYFWATHAGAELDLVWQHGGSSWGCEFKYQDAPKMTKSIGIALEDLGLKKLWIVYPGSQRYKLEERVEVVPLAEVPMEWVY